MNLVTIPFHDWRKIISEGFRTRDAHFIESFGNSNVLCKILVINRPTTILEILLRKKKRKIEGDVVLKEGEFTLIKVSDKMFVVDFVSKDFFGQIKKKYLWFIEKYKDTAFIAFIHKSIKHLDFGEYKIVSQNVFAHKLAVGLNQDNMVFDAWDNFSKIDDYFSIHDKLVEAYEHYALHAKFWTTNSSDNVRFFSDKYNPQLIYLIKNGLDLKRFNASYKYVTPSDLEAIPRPIVGFGGKVTQTLDVELLNHAIKECSDVSFVFVGQILDKSIFNSILNAKNVHYLGDKHYDIYPNYVHGFDICIVPYHVLDEKSSGTNPIKVYEYLSLGRKVIGTNGNGLEDLKDFLYLIDTKEDLVAEIKKGIKNTKQKIDISEHSWETKTIELLKLLQPL